MVYHCYEQVHKIYFLKLQNEINHGYLGLCWPNNVTK